MFKETLVTRWDSEAALQQLDTHTRLRKLPASLHDDTREGSNQRDAPMITTATVAVDNRDVCSDFEH